METKAYFKLTKREIEALLAIAAVAPIYSLAVDLDDLKRDPFKRRCTAALMIGLIGRDLRDMALESYVSDDRTYCAGFGVFSSYVQKISILL